MGIGGTIFRSPVLVLGALCAAAGAGCRTEHSTEELRLLLESSADFAPRPSFVVGHRFGRWLEVEPDPAARSALEEACLLEQTGATEEAIEVLNDALEDRPACAALLDARGALYVATGFPRAAAGDFQRAVALAPLCARSWFALGHAYEILSLTRQALDAFERAVSLGSRERLLFLSLARTYRSLGRRGQAAHHYELALARHEPAPTELLVEAALLASEDRARSATVDAMRDRLDSCRGTRLSDEAWLLRALLQESPGEEIEQVTTYVQALELEPDELAGLTAGLLTALQLVDPETKDAARERLLAAEPDETRRTALEQCLARK